MNENDVIIEYIKRNRDASRPSMGTVVAVMDGLFADAGAVDLRIVPRLRGPGTWTWEDMTMHDQGAEKVFVLSESVMPGTEGHPLLTIRQGIAMRLDSYITSSALIIGPGPDEIARSISFAVANHAGAYAGMRFVIKALATSGGDVDAGLNAARDLMQQSGEMPTVKDITGMHTADEREMN